LAFVPKASFVQQHDGLVVIGGFEHNQAFILIGFCAGKEVRQTDAMLGEHVCNVPKDAWFVSRVNKYNVILLWIVTVGA
jgi:hypothetical protein